MRIVYINNKNFILRFLVVLSICFGMPFLAHAQVTGPCANCHTMHNSADNADQVHLSVDGGGWNASNVLGAGTASGTPQTQLLKSDCIGCHSSSEDLPIVTMAGGGLVPIVWNRKQPAAQLAGGNFFWTSGANHANGHSVAGIVSGPDPNVNGQAPGMIVGCGASCHTSLYSDTTNVDWTGPPETGCVGCHQKVGHHIRRSDDPTAPGPVDGAGDSYRFLAGHGGLGLTQIVDSKDINLEGVRWGLENSANLEDENIYRAIGTAEDGTSPLALGRWCAGCHGYFHATGKPDGMFMDGVDFIDNGGDTDRTALVGSPWLRHPTNVFIPSNVGSEYATGGLLGSPYKPAIDGIPMARSVLARGGNVTPNFQVMCISCHKAHGSQYPDGLRFDYNAVIAHSSSSKDLANGCFFCHRLKDDM